MSVKFKQSNPDFFKKLFKRYTDKDLIALGFPAHTKGTTTRYPDGEQVAFVATINEFGSRSRNIPSRPFLKIGTKKVLKETNSLYKAGLRLINTGKENKSSIYNKIGAKAVDIVQQTITDIKDPPNKPSTIDKKKSSNPLIDTSLMRNTVTWAIIKNEK